MKSFFRSVSLGVCVLLCLAPTSAFSQQDDQLSPTFLQAAGAKANSTAIAPVAHTNGQAHARFGIFGIDSVPSWNDHFFAPGVDSNGIANNDWYTNTVGNPPNMHGTTVINAPVIPVKLDLRNADGTPRSINGQPLVYDAAQYIPLVLGSPVFQNSTYSSSSVPTQFTDAVQRAEYYAKAKPDWHTLLAPSVKPGLTMTLIRGTYRFALNPDGTCCAFVLVTPNAFIDQFVQNVSDAINNGSITTKDISSFIFPNTFLIDGNNFFTVGFHTYFFDPASPSNGNVEKRWLVNYSSWVTPDVFFGPAFADVTAHSHEIAETFNDPFVASDGVHNITPWWLSPNGNCQNNLEDGDVVEGLVHATFPIQMANGYTYHPQNEALLQWFKEGASDAINGDYSYPDESILTSPNSVQKQFCQ
jgi:hypothetical protein